MLYWVKVQLDNTGWRQIKNIYVYICLYSAWIRLKRGVNKHDYVYVVRNPGQKQL